MDEFMTIFRDIFPVISTIIIGILTYLVSRRTAQAQKVTADAEALSANAQVSATASEEWQKLYLEMRARMELLEKRADASDERAREAEKRLDAAEERAAEAEETANDARAQIEEVLADFLSVFDWIDTGMKPPPPIRPTYLKGLIHG